VTVLDDDTLGRALSTLRGPLRALVAQGAHLSFEEPVSLFVDDGQGGACEVHGVADLVARFPSRLLVVELKSSARAASSERTKLQLYAYAQALLSRPRAEVAEPRVDVTAWALGDTEVPAPQGYGKAQRAALARALAAVCSPRAEASRGRCGRA
jgi:hypothetical protein